MPRSYRSLELRITEAASDYKLALQNESFAEQYGGADALRKELLDLVSIWEEEDSEVT